MPDLGKYAVAVLSAYGVSLILIVAIIALTWWRSRRIHARLEKMEARRRNG